MRGGRERIFPRIKSQACPYMDLHFNFKLLLRQSKSGVGKEFPDTEFQKGVSLLRTKSRDNEGIVMQQADLLLDQRVWTFFLSYSLFIASRQRKFLLEGWH